MIYKLNLPLLSECILDGVAERYLQPRGEQVYDQVIPYDFFKPEYLSLKNLNWTGILIFSKNTPGFIHTDTDDPKSMTMWGINWIYNGFGIMEYWNYDNFKEEDKQYVVDEHSFPTFRFVTNHPPSLRYFMKPGAYLVNASAVHRATGINNRFCVSYRTSDVYTPWSNIIKMFDDLIDPSFISN